MTRDEQIARAAIEACAKALASNPSYEPEWVIRRLDTAAIVTSVQQDDSLQEMVALTEEIGGYDTPIPDAVEYYGGVLSDDQLPQPTSSDAPKPHRWDGAGERCLDCGDKDWMAGPHCSWRPNMDAPEMPEPDIDAILNNCANVIWHIADIQERMRLFARLVIAERDRQWQVDRQDAAQYRWLRDHTNTVKSSFGVGQVALCMGKKSAAEAVELDRYIKAAIAQEQGK